MTPAAFCSARTTSWYFPQSCKNDPGVLRRSPVWTGWALDEVCARRSDLRDRSSLAWSGRRDCDAHTAHQRGVYRLHVQISKAIEVAPPPQILTTQHPPLASGRLHGGNVHHPGPIRVACVCVILCLSCSVGCGGWGLGADARGKRKTGTKSKRHLTASACAAYSMYKAPWDTPRRSDVEQQPRLLARACATVDAITTPQPQHLKFTLPFATRGL